MQDGSAIFRCPIEKVGGVLAAQGNLPEALKSYQGSLAIVTASPRPIREMQDGSAIYRCPTRR